MDYNMDTSAKVAKLNLLSVGRSKNHSALVEKMTKIQYNMHIKTNGGVQWATRALMG